jgi:hypothetical protein
MLRKKINIHLILSIYIFIFFGKRERDLLIFFTIIYIQGLRVFYYYFWIGYFYVNFYWS